MSPNKKRIGVRRRGPCSGMTASERAVIAAKTRKANQSIRPAHVCPIAWLYTMAVRKAGHMATYSEAATEAKRRRVSAVFTAMLEKHLGYPLVVNQPPPGWSVEQDIAEEALALNELTLARRCSQEAHV